jgi:hypothetical protein
MGKELLKSKVIQVSLINKLLLYQSMMQESVEVPALSAFG